MRSRGSAPSMAHVRCHRRLLQGSVEGSSRVPSKVPLRCHRRLRGPNDNTLPAGRSRPDRAARADVRLPAPPRPPRRPALPAPAASALLRPPHRHDAEAQPRDLLGQVALHVATQLVHVLHRALAVEPQLDLHEPAVAAGARVQRADAVVVLVVAGQHPRDGQLVLLRQRQVHEGAEVVAHEVHAHPEHVAGHDQRHRRVDAVADGDQAAPGEEGAHDEGDQHAAVGHHADEVVGLVGDEQRRWLLGAPHEAPRQGEEHGARRERERHGDQAREVPHLGCVDEPLGGVEQHVQAGRDVEHAAEEGGEVLELAGAVGVAVGVVLEHLAHGVHGERVDDQRDGRLRGQSDERRRTRQHGARGRDDHDRYLDDEPPAQQLVQLHRLVRHGRPLAHVPSLFVCPTARRPRPRRPQLCIGTVPPTA